MEGDSSLTRSIQETKELFNSWASSYEEDVRNANGILEGYEISLETASQVCNVSHKLRVLDVGIGTGKLAQFFEDQGAKISGIDLSEVMIDKCRELHPDYDLRLGTFQQVPFQDDTFDAVVSSFCFHEVPPAERLTACREVYRVIRKGGYFCLLDIMFASGAAVAEARNRMLSQWDDSEEYSLVGDLSEHLYNSGFHSVQWLQTGKLHWVCLAYK
jgi:putative AdoMet-dependent methyltransferase